VGAGDRGRRCGGRIIYSSALLRACRQDINSGLRQEARAQGSDPEIVLADGVSSERHHQSAVVDDGAAMALTGGGGDLRGVLEVDGLRS
jgi:hypothetical protein